MDKGVLTHAKSYTAYVWKCTLQPIYVLIPPVSLTREKKSVQQPPIPGLAPSNPQSLTDPDITTTTVLEDSQASEFEQKLEACQKAGIYYHPKDGTFLRKFSFQEVLKAIGYFLFNREGVRQPEGWFRVCLEDNWAEKEQQRQQQRDQWSTEGLFEAIRYCNQMMGGVVQQE
ncbi:MAG TPA: hypothetical protein V6C90_04565 [Coleofasciculaceae cyanobacterium]